jgi:hypothetical protein
VTSKDHWRLLSRLARRCQSARPVVEPGKKVIAMVVVAHCDRHCAAFRNGQEGALHLLPRIGGRRSHADPFDGPSFFEGCERVIPCRFAGPCWNGRCRPHATGDVLKADQLEFHLRFRQGYLRTMFSYVVLKNLPYNSTE